MKECLAFSLPHELYQETVGVWIVPVGGTPRGVDLPELDSFLEARLHRSKWPQVIVYSSSLPKNQAGKVLRIKLAERTQISCVDERQVINC